MKRKQPAGISDATVRVKTGRIWAEWFQLLDEAGAAQWRQAEIVNWLKNQHSLRPWWRQMISRTYQQARGLRQKTETAAAGCQISAGRTFSEPVESLYDAWITPAKRARWLRPADIKIQRSTPGESIRILWGISRSRIDVRFSAAPKGKSRVTIHHRDLPDVETARRMKAHWAGVLEKLNRYISGPYQRTG